MKLNNNNSFASWRTWFELSTILLAVSILVTINTRTIDMITVTGILTINWILSVAVGLRKY